MDEQQGARMVRTDRAEVPPFDAIVPGVWRRALGGALALTATIAVVFTVVGAPLGGPDTPLGVVSLQFVADPDRAAAIADGWGEDGRGRALFLLGLDMLFPLAYASSIGLAASIVASRDHRARPKRIAVARGIAGAALAAAGLDVIENAAMVRTVLGIAGDVAAPLTVAMAVPKFALLALALVALVGIALPSRDADRGRIRSRRAD